jgi:hypothetical protein
MDLKYLVKKITKICILILMMIAPKQTMRVNNTDVMNETNTKWAKVT